MVQFQLTFLLKMTILSLHEAQLPNGPFAIIFLIGNNHSELGCVLIIFRLLWGWICFFFEEAPKWPSKHPRWSILSPLRSGEGVGPWPHTKIRTFWTPPRVMVFLIGGGPVLSGHVRSYANRSRNGIQKEAALHSDQCVLEFTTWSMERARSKLPN